MHYTTGVCGILGSTYTGEFEDIKALDAAVGKLNAEKGWQARFLFSRVQVQASVKRRCLNRTIKSWKAVDDA